MSNNKNKALVLEERRIIEAKRIASVVKPLLAQGLSPYRIVTIHPELGISEKTLYNYSEGQVFSIAGIHDIGLRKKTSRRISKKQAKTYKKREGRSFLKCRMYGDYQNCASENPLSRVLQMDTVYNDVTNGPFIQTFKFIGLGLLLAIYHGAKTSGDMESKRFIQDRHAASFTGKTETKGDQERF